MNQTIRFIIIGLLIVAIAIWSVIVIRSCQESKENAKPAEDISEAIDTSSLEDLYETEDDSLTDDFDDTGDVIREDTDDVESDFVPKPPPVTSSNAEFLVIAGAFTVESNAQRVVNRLNQQGYKAEIRVFVGSQYHSVVAGAYDDMDSAFDVAIKLADAGYKDVYVHKKRQKKRK